MTEPLYTLAAVAYLGAALLTACGTLPSAAARVRVGASIVGMLALALHLAGLILRAVHAHRLPIQNQYESMIVVALMAALSGAIVSRLTRHPAARIAGFLAGAITLAIAVGAPVPGKAIEAEAPILSTASLLKFHVTTIIAGYGLSALAGMLAIAWLIMRTKRDALARATATAARLTFWVLGVGILLGAWWAHRAWGRWWAFDAKETWALLLWLVYFLPVHLSAVSGGSGGGGDARAARIIAWSCIVGTIVMAWSYFGVNLLLTSLHAYA